MIWNLLNSTDYINLEETLFSGQVFHFKKFENIKDKWNMDCIDSNSDCINNTENSQNNQNNIITRNAHSIVHMKAYNTINEDSNTISNASSNASTHSNNIIYAGVVSNNIIILKQYNKKVLFLSNSIMKNEIENILIDFFNLNISDILFKNIHINNISNNNGLRFLTNDFYSTVFSFICSSNNNISRISKMVNFLYSKGEPMNMNLGDNNIINVQNDDFLNISKQLFKFPDLNTLCNIENDLINNKFGYRASYIVNAAKYLLNTSTDWHGLQYNEARYELTKIKGIGRKVADCICLIGLKHFQAVPIDVHILKYSNIKYNMAVKTLSASSYEEIQKKWIDEFGDYAGIAQLYAFKRHVDMKKKQSKK